MLRFFNHVETEKRASFIHESKSNRRASFDGITAERDLSLGILFTGTGNKGNSVSMEQSYDCDTSIRQSGSVSLCRVEDRGKMVFSPFKMRFLYFMTRKNTI